MVTRYENSGDCRSTGADRLHWIRINRRSSTSGNSEGGRPLYYPSHADHCDIYTVKALLKTTTAKFIGPKMTTPSSSVGACRTAVSSR